MKRVALGLLAGIVASSAIMLALAFALDAAALKCRPSVVRACPCRQCACDDCECPLYCGK